MNKIDFALCSTYQITFNITRSFLMLSDATAESGKLGDLFVDAEKVDGTRITLTSPKSLQNYVLGIYCKSGLRTESSFLCTYKLASSIHDEHAT